jgi:LPXTG-site transpeptidase (sortase) family protein
MARDLSAAEPRAHRFARPLTKLWVAMLVLGVAAVIAGAALIVGPLVGVFSRGSADQSALQAWNSGGSSKLVGPAKGGSQDVAKVTCGSSSPSDYALVTFTGLPQYHYAGVAGNGTWDLLNSRSMVHYTGTPNPGQQGNVIIAFHREPDYQYITQLGVGSTITIQDKACHNFVYKVVQTWDLAPAAVTQLTPTAGYDLTMITCDPWWQDYDRFVWRAQLISPAPGTGAPGVFGGGGSAQSSGPGQPQF